MNKSIMKKLVFGIAFLLAISSITPNAVCAAEKQDGSSARLAIQTDENNQNSDDRVVALQNFLRAHNSPLVEYASVFVKAADKYNVDWKLLPSISGVESSFGIEYLSGTYNAYGWGSGTIPFASWEDGIMTINKSLRENYINQLQTDNVWSIGHMYAESPTWADRVYGYMQELDADYIQLTSQKVKLTI